MHFVVIGILIGLGIVLAVAFFGEIMAAIVAAPILLAVLAVVLVVGLFAANLIYSMVLQAPWLLVALLTAGGFVFVTARRGATVRRGERL